MRHLVTFHWRMNDMKNSSDGCEQKSWKCRSINAVQKMNREATATRCHTSTAVVEGYTPKWGNKNHKKHQRKNPPWNTIFNMRFGHKRQVYRYLLRRPWGGGDNIHGKEQRRGGGANQRSRGAFYWREVKRNSHCCNLVNNSKNAKFRKRPLILSEELGQIVGEESVLQFL